MHPGIWALAGLGGLVGYEVLSKKTMTASQPAVAEKQPFWSSWLDSGSSPQTANGAPKTDIQGITGAISDVSKFGTSLANYFGTSNGSGSTGNGLGTQTNEYGFGSASDLHSYPGDEP